MGLLLNRAKCNTSTTGTGTVTFGSAIVPFQSWSAAGAVNGSAYDYLIEDGNAWELGTGVYNSSAGTLTRPGPGSDANFASSSGSLLNLSGSATIGCVANKNSGGGVTTPTIRATSAIYAWNASTYNMPFPTGTVAGDLVIVWQENGYGPGAGPSGWTQIGYANNGWTNGYAYAKIVTSADITTGYVTVNAGGSYAGAIGIMTVQGSTVNAMDATASYGSSGSGSVASVSITGLLGTNPKDLLVGFIATRGQMSISVSSGLTILQTMNQANASAVIVQGNSGALGVLGLNETATFPNGNNGALYFLAAFH